MKAWAIKSERLILPFTIRMTKKQAIKDYCRNRYLTGLPDYEKAAKVEVKEIK